MLHAVRTGARGLVIYGLIGLAAGAFLAFAVFPCGSGPGPALAEQIMLTAEFAAGFSGLGFVVAFGSAYLFDKPDPDRGSPSDFSR